MQQHDSGVQTQESAKSRRGILWLVLGLVVALVVVFRRWWSGLPR